MVGGVLLLLGGFLLLRGRPAGPWLSGIGGVLMAAAWLVPSWLRPLQRPWMMLAVLLGAVVSPLVLGMIYFGVFTPVGLLARWRGRDFLQGRPDPGLDTYWKDRSGSSADARYERQG